MQTNNTAIDYQNYTIEIFNLLPSAVAALSSVFNVKELLSGFNSLFTAAF
jgi:hypothetical protein